MKKHIETEIDKLREADERMQLMLDATPLVAHFWDENFQIVDCNQAAVTLFNLSSKQEYIDRYFDLTPEFQPDGTRSKDKLRHYIAKTFEEGYEKTEWMRCMLDGEPIPVEVTFVRVDYKGKNLIAAYCRDLRDHKRMMADIERRDNLLNSLNRVSTVLLAAADEENFEESLITGMQLLGQCLDADCVQVWPNEMIDDTLHFTLKYKWLSDTGKKAPDVPIGTAVPYPERWLDLFGRDECVNGPIAELPQVDQDLLGPLGLTSTITIPLYYQNKFWGVFCVDDCIKERYFTDEEVGILRSAALMLVNAINRNQQDAEIREAHKRTLLLLDTAPLAVNFWDKDFNLFDCNEEAVRLFKVKNKQEYIDRFYELSPELQPDGSRASERAPYYLQKAFKDGKCVFEWVHQTVDREPIPSEVTMVRVAYGNSYAVAAYCRDLREHKERERELLSAHELNELQLTKLNAVVKASRIGIWDVVIVDNDPINPGNIFTWTDEFRSMLGYKDESDFPNTADSYFSKLHPEDAEGATEAIVRHIQDKTGNTPYDMEYRLLKKNSEYGYFRASGEAIRDEEGNALRIAGAVMDITESKNILHDTERQKIEAEAANKAKTTFLSTMSHEIRTPMNAILGITDIQLQNDSLDPGVKEALEKIHASGDLLLGIINDILDLSKIEAGKLELMIGRYELASLVSNTAQLNMMRIGSKLIKFELYVDEYMPSHMLGDELRIRQILNNVLSNAFKYTAEGTVKLTITAVPSKKSNDEVILVFEVSDTGQGMTKEQVSELFDEYSRFNLQANRSTEGTGLGMSITKNLIWLMGGKISVESEPGVGSVFTIHLPQGRAETHALGKEMAENLHLFRTNTWAQMKRVQVKHEPMPYGSVLIVDDVETNIYVARGLLTPYGLKIDSADSGFTAIEKIKQGNEYDIVFMDHMMPKMDGIEATKIIRDMGYTHTIVALTANAVAGQADIFLTNGFDDFISKPIDIRQLNIILNKYIRDKQPPEVVAAARQQAGKHNAQDSADPVQPGIDPQLTELFLQDANKSIKVLDSIIEKGSPYSEEDIRLYVIHTHGMKSALINVKKSDLSAIALKLEQLGRDNNVEAITTETPAFLSALKDFVSKLTPQGEETTGEATEENKRFLSEKLQEIRAACEDWDKSKAREVLALLREKTWQKQIKELLDKINEQLLHSDFDEITEEIDKFTEEQ